MAIKSKVKKSIKKRLLLSFLVLLLITFLLTTLIFASVSKQFVIKETQKDLLKSAGILEKNLIQIYKATENSEIAERTRFRKLISDIELFNDFNRTETVVLSTDDEIVYPLRGWTSERLSNLKKQVRINKDSHIFYEYKMTDKSLPISTIILMKRYDDASNIRNVGLQAFGISFIVGGILAIILSVLLSQRLSKPIRLLSKSMDNYMMHKEAVVIYHSNDEIELLAENFQKMTNQLIQLDERQKQFFQNSSHELKTPLMSIQGYAEAIKDGVVKAEDVDHSLDVIIAESQRLKSIVDDVIYLSKIDNMEEEIVKKEHDFDQLLNEASEVVKPLLEVNHLVLEIQCQNIRVSCDYDKMKRVFINLIGNASRYAKSKVVVNVNQVGPKTFIDVIDDGPGFEPGQEEKVFDRFYNGKKGGSGIGLSLTKEIIEKHKGRIYAINNMNYGAIFKIEI